MNPFKEFIHEKCHSLYNFQYYYHLREMAFDNGIKFPVSLLTVERAVRLEASSKLKVGANQKAARGAPKTSYPLPKHRRCFSLDFNQNDQFSKNRWVIS